jgi:PhzF family phenazine biosynthesis protein
MTAHPLFCVDAFAAEAFTGNPAAVCLLTDEPTVDWMRKVAAELNLSETAFLSAKAEDRYAIRWFTPTGEIDLCGHATLAAGHVLYERARVPEDRPVVFESASHTLTVEKTGDGAYALDLPLIRPRPAPPLPALFASLRLPDDGRSLWTGGGFYLVELDDEAAVREVAPDMARLALLGGTGVVVTARSSDAAVDFVSRVFAPAVGIDEDPVTGSAHGLLAPYWQSRLDAGNALRARQLSRRGGELTVRIVDETTVRLTGRAVTVWEGIVRV